MRTSWLKFLVVFGISLVASIPAQAQPLFPHADSIEATVANADSVYIAKLVKFGDAKRRDGRVVHDTTIIVEETLKTDVFTDEHERRRGVYMPQSASVLADWKKRSSRLLVAENEYAPYAATVIELEPGRTEVMTADLVLLRDPAAVIKAARRALAQMPASVKRIHTFRLQVPRKLVAGTKWDKYYGTSGHLKLSVPVDKRLEKKAQAGIRSKSYVKRIESVRALRYFKSDQNIARVKTLLADAGSNLHPPDEKGIEVRYYGVRNEAYGTLKYWGVDVKKPVIRERKQTQRR